MGRCAAVPAAGCVCLPCLQQYVVSVSVMTSNQPHLQEAYGTVCHSCEAGWVWCFPCVWLGCCLFSIGRCCSLAHTLCPVLRCTMLCCAVDMADGWAAKYGCSGSKGNTPLVFLAGVDVACRDLCTAAAGGSGGDSAAAGQRPAAIWLCGVQQNGHDWLPIKADVAW